ncbi:hypothetical protein N0V84_008052 [Fusarium piperis]|uniref:Uncharacterized protein n=1 Tax=Fusarium piperis TaxID=1435070 RepID=A0A9W8W917_9HYPO|nr:hypothetical protein N0V84_008052 [Fusarium piperis]
MLGIAADCTYAAEFDSLTDVQSNILNQINTASQVYEDTFNIALRVMNLTISDRNCPVNAPKTAPWSRGCTAKESVADRLSLFSKWSTNLNDEINHVRPAVWTLLTACNSESVVGMSWEGQVSLVRYMIAPAARAKPEDGMVTRNAVDSAARRVTLGPNI